MSAGMPELGSKISLISKADIRYEGRLFTVDPQECTIALASVRSFGTENRETEFPVPAQNQVYDYILFRGSDIKDIRIINNVQPNVPTVPQPLNDPAIMQLTVPPSLGPPPFSTSHPVLGPIGGAQMNQYGSGYGLGNIGGMSSGLTSGLGVNRDPGARSMPKNLIGGGTRSTTPASLSSRKSPTMDQGTQVGGKPNQKTIRPIQPPNQRPQQRRPSRERRDNRMDGQQNQNRQGGPRNQGPTGYHQQMNNQPRQQPNWNINNRGPPLRQSRGRPRGGGGGSGNYKGNQQNKAKNPLKFDGDYDFEQANTEFEELRSQFAAKVKVNEEAPTPKVTETSTTEGDKKDDSGNETGAGENEVEEEQEVFYDKSKSFFDKISCEAVERAKGKSQRTDWRTERKLNSETFGVAATRRGNYRGRGGYRGGMGYRGGYRTNYRQPQPRQQNNQRTGPMQNQQNTPRNPPTNQVLPSPEFSAQEN